MGHDIFARRGKPEVGREMQFFAQEETAYLRRGAFNNLGREIYKALDATQYDAGCSGNGEDVYFTQQQIADSLKRLPQGEQLEPEREFLSDCLAAGGDGVTISFC